MIRTRTDAGATRRIAAGFPLAALLGLCSTAGAQVVSVQPFVGTLREKFENLPGYSCPPCQFNCLSSFHVLVTPGAVICDPTNNSGLTLSSQSSLVCSVGPHGGQRFLSSVGSSTTITFNYPIHKVGGWFANFGGQGSAKVEFFSASGQLIDEVSLNVNGCEWTWNGWAVDPNFETVKISGPSTLVMDDLEGEGAGMCYADCTGDLNLLINDFACFQNDFANGGQYADCDYNGSLTIADFACFQTRFSQGCP
jgi:hypothetical protein